ncbi:MAG: protease inhibitor I42 family protein [Desulfovibrio sp.]|jgi:inhibitor of cysteine peptidase|nr:protease inhibitor I42 family protein [Desulfovibrio sp.]
MIMPHFFVIALCGLVFFISAVSPAYAEAEDAEQILRLSVNREVEVRLPCNLGTGFQWTVENVPAFLEQIGESICVRDNADTKMVGAGGSTGLRFKAVAEGAGILRFLYRRPWEPGVSPAKIVVYRVFVE